MLYLSAGYLIIWLAGRGRPLQHDMYGKMGKDFGVVVVVSFSNSKSCADTSWP